MSIGKTLSNLRKQKGISQEELATFLHVSRQTISKWEADLSLPNMEMILKLSEYYEIPVTRLLGIEEDQKVTNESVERLYEQTSVVLENIQKENKKRQTRDVILIVTSIVSICLVLALSFIVLTKESEPPVINNNYENRVEYTEPSIIKEYDIQENKIDLTKRIVQSHYEVELSSFTKKTSVQLVLVDTDKKKYQYQMEHDLDGKFTLDKEVPLKDYQKIYIDVDDGKGNLKKEDLETENFYFSDALNHSLHVLVKLKQDKLDMSTIYIEPDYIGPSYNDEEFEYIGTLNGDAIIHLKDLDNKDDQGNWEVILETKQPLDQKKKYHLNEDIPYNHEISYVIEIEIDGKKYEAYNGSTNIKRQYYVTHDVDFLDNETIY